MKKRCKWLLMLFLFGISMAYTQQKTVSGTVTDQSGIPLPGVNILVKNTTTGTQTDFDGNYSIQASEGQILNFSYIGQETVEITVASSNIINVQMQEDAQVLEEVVVTAQGIVR